MVWLGGGAKKRIPDFHKARLLASTLRLEEFNEEPMELETLPADDTAGRQIIRGVARDKESFSHDGDFRSPLLHALLGTGDMDLDDSDIRYRRR